MSRPRQCADCGTTNPGGAWIGQGSAFGHGTRWRCSNCQTRHSAEAAQARRDMDAEPTGFAPPGTRAPRVAESDPRDPHAWYGGKGSLLHPSVTAKTPEPDDSPSDMARKMLEQRQSQNAEMEAWGNIFKDRRKK